MQKGQVVDTNIKNLYWLLGSINIYNKIILWVYTLIRKYLWLFIYIVGILILVLAASHHILLTSTTRYYYTKYMDIT